MKDKSLISSQREHGKILSYIYADANILFWNECNSTALSVTSHLLVKRVWIETEGKIQCLCWEIKMEYPSVTSPPPNTFRPIQDPNGHGVADPQGAADPAPQPLNSKTPKLGNWRQGSDNWSSTGSRQSSRFDELFLLLQDHWYNHDHHPADLAVEHRALLDLPLPTSTADLRIHPCQRWTQCHCRNDFSGEVNEWTQ